MTELTLNELSIKYSLDKNIITRCHNYIPKYQEILTPIKNNVNNMLEIGIGSVENGQMSGVIKFGYKTGNSLRCWKDFFINSKIYGLDIFEVNIKEDRITTIIGDQSNEKDLQNLVNIINDKIDVIIDDGSHKVKDQVFTFTFLEKYLSKNGIYIIEDIQPENIDNFISLKVFPENYIEYLKMNYKIEVSDTRDVLNREDDVMIIFTKI